MVWREEDNGERVILSEDKHDFSQFGKGTRLRQVYVQKSDAADIWTRWSGGKEPDEASAVSLNAADMDELCLWWILRGRPDYRALIRESSYLEENPWIQTPDSFIELLHQREMD